MKNAWRDIDEIEGMITSAATLGCFISSLEAIKSGLATPSIVLTASWIILTYLLISPRKINMKSFLNRFWPRKTPEVKPENPPLRLFKIKTRQLVNNFYQDVDAQFETNMPEKDFFLVDSTGFGLFGYCIKYFDENAVVFYSLGNKVQLEAVSVEDFYKNHIQKAKDFGAHIEIGENREFTSLIFRQVGAQ